MSLEIEIKFGSVINNKFHSRISRSEYDEILNKKFDKENNIGDNKRSCCTSDNKRSCCTSDNKRSCCTSDNKRSCCTSDNKRSGNTSDNKRSCCTSDKVVIQQNNKNYEITLVNGKIVKPILEIRKELIENKQYSSDIRISKNKEYSKEGKFDFNKEIDFLDLKKE